MDKIKLSPWCCIQEETIRCEDKTKIFPKTNIKTEAIKLVNNETNHLIHTKFPCDFREEEEELDFIIEPKSLFDYSESQIVEQMSFCVVKYLKKLKVKEILHIISPSITKIIDDFNKFSLYFSSCILNFETPETRALLISKLIDIAHFACYNEKLPNLNLGMIIFSCLNRSEIHRLKISWSMVQNKQKHSEIDNLFLSSGFNYSYKMRVNEIESGIVFFGTFLSEITFIWEGTQFTELNSNVLTFNLKSIQNLHSIIADNIVRTSKNINGDILVKNLNLQETLEFCTLSLPFESDLYEKSLYYEPRQGLPNSVSITSNLSLICDKILNIGQSENYFGVKEKHVIALLPKTGIENYYSVLKKLSKQKLTALCSSVQNLLVEFGASFFQNNDCRLLFI